MHLSETIPTVTTVKTSDAVERLMKSSEGGVEVGCGGSASTSQCEEDILVDLSDWILAAISLHKLQKVRLYSAPAHTGSGIQQEGG